MSLDIEKLKLLSEHYAHTFDFLQTHISKRDRLFLALLVLVALLLFQLYTPDISSKVVSQLATNQLGLTTPLDFLYVQSIIWFVLLAVVVKYFQAVVFIERQYGYLHSLERTLNNEYGGTAFTREGESYLKKYPAFLSWASFLYTVLFPVILVIVSTGKIISEHQRVDCFEILLWFNTVVYLLIVVSIGLYLYVIHRKDKGAHNNAITSDA